MGDIWCCHSVLCVQSTRLCAVMVQESSGEPFPCQGFALLQGFPSQQLPCSHCGCIHISLVVPASFHLECCEAVLGFLLLLALLGRL